MSIKFVVRERVNPRDVTAPKKFYPIAKSAGEIDLRRIAQRIASMCTVNRADVLAVLDALIQVMKEEVADGNIIHLGDFGTFIVSIGGTGDAKAENITAANVQWCSLNFRPGWELNDMLETMKYEKMANDTPPAPPAR